MKNSIKYLMCALVLGGCKTYSPTVSMSQTITENAQDAKKVIQATNSLEQCKIASVAQINAIVRQANDMAISHKTELESKDKDIRFWFWAFVTAVSVVGAYVLLKFKKLLSI